MKEFGANEELLALIIVSELRLTIVLELVRRLGR